MPEDIQLLPEDKTRESDPKLRQLLVDCLVLLTTTSQGRMILRARKVYPVIRELHKVESFQPILDSIDTLVQMLMRDEPSEQKVDAAQAEEDFKIEEIV